MVYRFWPAVPAVTATGGTIALCDGTIARVGRHPRMVRIGERSEVTETVRRWRVVAPGLDVVVPANCRGTALGAAWRLRDAGTSFGTLMAEATVTCLDPPPAPMPVVKRDTWRPSRMNGYAIPRDRPDTVCVYVVECGPFAKIGISQNVKNRLQVMRGACPYPINLVATFVVLPEEACGVERATMEALRAHHHQGEWFRCMAGLVVEAVAQTIARKSLERPDELPPTAAQLA